MKIDAKTCYEGIFPIYQQVHGAQYLWKVICDIGNRILGRKVDDPDYLRDITYGFITILPVVGTIFNLFLYVVMYRNIPVDTPVKVDDDKGKDELSQASEELEDRVSEEAPPPPPRNYPKIDKVDLNVVIKELPDPEAIPPKNVVTPAVESSKEDKPQEPQNKPTDANAPLPVAIDKPTTNALLPPVAIEELKKTEKKTFRRALSARFVQRKEKTAAKLKAQQQTKADVTANVIK